MKPLRPKVYYFRSLNTSGKDRINIGPILLGSFSSHFKKEFDGSKLDFIPVLGVGSGSLLDQVERAKKFLKIHEDFKLSERNIHFFGHSAGGLLAKIVGTDPYFQNRVRSILTIGTPHSNCQAAIWAASLTETNPKLAFLYKLLGYDFEKKKATFQSFAEVSRMSFSFPQEIFTASLVCAPSKKTWSPLFKLIHKLPVMKEFEQPSDGLIQKQSQIFGDFQEEFELDHIQQIGFGGQKAEFKKMCRFLENVWTSLQKNQNFFKREISFSASLSSERDAES